MPVYKTDQLFDLSRTIAQELLRRHTYPWQALSDIGEHILQLGETLSQEKYEKRGENVWVAKSANVAQSACITGPCIIDEEAEIRHCAFIRGNAIVGKKAVVGNSTELKNVILFDGVQVPHYNYVGDSILGYHAHLGAGAITSNVKSDNSDVHIKAQDEALNTHRRKVGAIVGDNADVGCNSVLCPGCVLGKNVRVYPLSLVRGQVAQGSILKSNSEVVPIKE